MSLKLYFNIINKIQVRSVVLLKEAFIINFLKYNKKVFIYSLYIIFFTIKKLRIGHFYISFKRYRSLYINRSVFFNIEKLRIDYLYIVSWQALLSRAYIYKQVLLGKDYIYYNLKKLKLSKL
ncbi:hypothetical protein B0T21DRAFT_348427 [Apiosordaria backusii]|uniref:Uncharacterized protein n=1 Tax=Apiosordaria backusii TaxID=314023 RepID=A0AA40EHP5_9PEZI|nr:hypothetical protein B0T21DRAFT_348427 [Apiosordaria backusii]